jgi:hypothetical protein
VGCQVREPRWRSSLKPGGCCYKVDRDAAFPAVVLEGTVPLEGEARLPRVRDTVQSDDAPADHQEVGRRRGSAGIARLHWSFSLDSGWGARLRRVSVAYSQSNLMGVSLNEVERVVF